ncbi:2'-5' RNA ligase family protein [Gemmatimonas sp.]|uniref:2'-5' RNA ligase family protein n=1 Tax=Gemmatimonas sp. TaxID=1962908 RepID=UPI00286D7A13|nr:2'-5' RNA ligase family protein [Gemmatimonas sp.]
MTDAGRQRRRQVTLFVPPDAGQAIEAVRARVDPLQHRLIAAHVTLCREDELAGQAEDAWRDRLIAATVAPVTLTFGAPVSFSGHGVMLPCIAGEPAFHALRVQLLGDTARRRHEPHLTLAHPRNPRAPHNVPATYADLITPISLTFTTTCLIEQSGDDAWQVLDTQALRG